MYDPYNYVRNMRIDILTVVPELLVSPLNESILKRAQRAGLGFRTIEQPQGLWHILQRIEAKGKRERTIHWGPRTIDLDIVLFGDTVMQNEELTIPHREMHLREFVLRPLSQIAPWARHPVYHKTVNELLELCINR